MFFNSLEYALFLPCVFLFYWFIASKNLKLQNSFLLLASYFFYGWWDYRFLFLLAFSTFLDFYTGIKIHESQNNSIRKLWFCISVGVNLGFLGFFKYYNFFVESFAEVIRSVGLEPHLWMLNVILPVGISFYTFHGLSYIFDIYNRRITPTRKFIDYSVFVSFFPLLVAGPIERATHLLPQVEKPRYFNYSLASQGMRLILYGLFKKVVVADNCAIYVNEIFANYQTVSGLELILGTIFFSFQIYCDFSGYTDIARGTAKLLGFDLLQNFSFPYFSRDIAEFWRRWHISLTTWFRDYLYIPLGGSRKGTLIAVRNTFIVFIVSGFWHGANWTFLFWGFLNALYFLPLLLLNKNRDHLAPIESGKMFPGFKELLGILLTFSMTSFAWIFFRSRDLSSAFGYIRNCIVKITHAPVLLPSLRYELILVIPVFLMMEWKIRENGFDLYCERYKPLVRNCIYLFLVTALFMFGKFNHTEFIYFQF